MVPSTKTIIEDGDKKKLRYLSFRDRVNEVSINPLYNDLFLGELSKENQYDSVSRNSGKYDSLCNILVNNDKVQVFHVGNELSKKGPFNDIESLNETTREITFFKQIQEDLQATYFLSVLQYWKEKNSTNDFSVLYRHIYPRSQSLTQLLHEAETIINYLLCEIEKKNSLVREAAYHLLSILARDLRGEFVNFLVNVLERLFMTLDINDIFVLEKTFSTVAFLFKFLFRPILLDLTLYLKPFECILQHEQTYIRSFGAEALSFLLRKSNPNDLEKNLRKVVLFFLHFSSFKKMDSSQGSNSPIYNKVVNDQDENFSNEAIQLLEEINNGEKNDLLDNTKEPLVLKKSKRLLESLGLLFFDVVKNINRGFICKVEDVVYFLLVTMFKEKSISDNITLSLLNFEDFYTIISVFFIQCRDHADSWDNSVLQKLHESLKKNIEQLEKTEKDENQQDTILLLTVDVLIKVGTDVACVKPYPKNESLIFLKPFSLQVVHVLNYFNKNICQSEAQLVLLKTILASFILILENATFSSELLQLLLCCLNPLTQVTKKYLDQASTNPRCLEAATHIFNFVLTIVEHVSVCQDGRLITGCSHIFLQLVYQFFLMDLHEENEHKIICVISRLLCLNASQQCVIKNRDNEWMAFALFLLKQCYEKALSYQNCHLIDTKKLDVFFSYISALKALVDSPGFVTTISNHHDFKQGYHHFLKQFANVLFHLFTLTTAHTHRTLNEKSQHLCTFLMLGHIFFSFLAYTDDTEEVWMEFEQVSKDFIRFHSSTAVLAWMTSVWEHVICFYCLQSSVGNVSSFIAFDQMTFWFISCMKLLKNGFTNDTCWTYLRKCLSYLLLSVAYISRKTRHSLLSWMCTLRGRDLHRLCCSFPIILFKETSFHTVGFTLTDNILMDFLPPDKNEVYSEDFQAFLLSILQYAYELESLENSLDNERDKCEYIRRMAQSNASLHSNLNHSLWIHLFVAQLILCQLSEKFSLLWSSVLESLKEFSSEAKVPLFFLSDEHEKLSKVFFYKRDLGKCRYFSGSLLNMFISRCLIFSLTCCVKEPTDKNVDKQIFMSSEIKPKGRVSKPKKRRKTKVAFVRQNGFFHNFVFCDALLSSFEHVINVYDVKRTDPITLHTWCCKALEIVLPQTWLIQYCSVKTHFFNKTMEFLLKNILMHAKGLCLDDSVEEHSCINVLPKDNLVHLPELIIKKNLSYGGVSRVLDICRLIILFQKVQNDGKTSLRISESVVKLYNFFVDYCFHRVIQIPEILLQKLCLELFACNYMDLIPYLTLLNDVVANAQLTRTLLKFSIDKDEGVVCLEHRKTVIPLILRLLVSKLFKNGKKHQDDLVVRRKLIFRFFSQLSNDEVPLIFSSIFSPILCVHQQLTTKKVTSEAHKEQVLYDFFKNVEENNFSRIPTKENSCIEGKRDKGQWSTIDKRHFIVLDTTIIHRLPMLAGIVLNITEIVNQMRLSIRVIEESCQFVNNNDHAALSHGDQQEKNLVLNDASLIKNNQYYRMLLRSCFRLLTKLIKMYSEHVNAWDFALNNHKETLEKLIQNSLLSGTLSTALVFVLSIAEDVTLFPLLTSSLSFALPLLCNNIASPPVLAAIRKGCNTPLVVSNILKFVLRLCRGGQLSLEVPESIKLADKNRIKEHQNNFRRKKKSRLNTSDSESDGSMELEPKALTREWKNHIENNLSFGINIVKIFGLRILESFSVLLQERQKSLHRVKGNQRYFAFQISDEELDTVTEILKHVSTKNFSNLDTIINILIKFFQVSRISQSSSVLLNRQKLIYSCISESLVNFSMEGETNESVLSLLGHVTKACYTHFLILNDIEIRHMSTKIFVICCLVEAKCKDIKKTLEELTLSISNASKEFSQKEQTELFLMNWFPDALRKNEWVSTDNSVLLRKVLTSFIVFGLSSLRQRVASLQADDDFQCILLTEIMQHYVGHETGEINKLYLEASNLQWILTHCLYILRTEACDNAVRMLALKFLMQSIDRVSKVVAVRKKLADSQQLTFPSDSSEALTIFEKIKGEWNECYHLFRYIVGTVIHAVYRALNSSVTQTIKSFITLLCHIVASFHNVSTYLPFVTHFSGFFSLPERDIKYTLNHNIIKQKLHLDLSCLINTKEESAFGEINRLNFFKDIIHVQKRRRLQALTALTKILKSSILSKATICHICTPIAFVALLQSDSISNNSVHLGLAEQGAQCLGEIAKYVEWHFCVKLVMRLIKCFRRFPNNNKLIVRSICLIICDMERHLQNVLSENSEKQKSFSNKILTVSCSSVLSDSTSQGTRISNDSSENSAVTQRVQNKVVAMQNVIETKLLPAIRQLALSFNKPKSEEFHDKEEPIVQYPQLIVAQVQLMKLLPKKKFNSLLPKLLQILALGLSSRNPEVRRKARTSICSTACYLGVPYLDYLFRFISQYLTKGYQVSVLIFTSSAILMEVGLGGAKRGKSLLKSKCLITPGTCDNIVPTLLPFIDQELARFCDPKRPNFQLHSFDDSVISKRPGADEERYLKSAEILLLLCRISSVECFMETIIPYVNELMLGSKYASIILSPTAASKKKYQHMVEFLFEQLIFGINSNAVFSRENKLRIVFNFLYLYDSINNNLTMSLENLAKLKNRNKVSELVLSCNSLFIKIFLKNHFDKEIEREEGTTSATQRRGQNTFSIQPGAATGRSAEQSYACSRPIDMKTCGDIFALAGLRLYFLVIQNISKDDEFIQIMRQARSSNLSKCLKENQKSSSLNKLTATADFLYCIKLCNTHVVRCFCGCDMRLLLFSAKILLKLIWLQCIDVDKNGAQISFVILKIFKEMGQSTSKTSLDSIRTTSFICVRLMAALLTQASSSNWFLRAVKADFKTGARTFHSVLLSQIRVSLEDIRTRIPALQLFKQILLLRDKNELLQEPENCALVYQCVDEIGIILVQYTAGVTKLINLCSSVFVDFLLNYPMAERIQKKRVNFLVSNLDHHLYQSRQAVLSTLYNFVNRLPQHILLSRFTFPLALALLLRLTKEEHYETRFVVKAVLKKLIEASFQNAFPVELTRIVDSALCSSSNKVLTSVFMEYLHVVVTCVTTQLALQHLPLYLEPVLRVLTFFFPTCFEKNTNQVIKEQSLESNEDWKLCFTFLRFFEHFLLLHTSCLYELFNDNFSSQTFQKLWVFCITSCSMHSHVWIRVGVLRLITLVIQRTDCLKSHQSSFLFSPALLTKLCSITKRKNSETITHVNPLSVLLWNYVNWSQDAQAEQLGLFCDTVVCGITTLCIALFTTSDCFGDTEKKISHTPAIPNDLTASDIKKDLLTKDQSKEQKPNRLRNKPKRVIKTVFLCKNDYGGADKMKTSSSTEEPIPSASYEKDYPSEEDWCDAALEDETILNAAENVSESLLKCATVMEPPVETFVKTNISVSLEINEEHVVELLKISRIRWTIGKLMWSIKYGTGKIQSHVVRICLSLCLLKGIVTQLPYKVFSFRSTRSIFDSIIEAVYICSSLLRHKSNFRLLKRYNINEVAVAAQTKYKESPKSLTGLVAYFGDATMQQIEMFMDQKNMSLIFFNSLQRIQKIVGSRRLQRKVTLKRLKALNPQKAALKKILLHQKKMKRRVNY